MAVRRALTPKLDDPQLEQYLIRRDTGAPTANPAPSAFASATVGATDMDTLTWQFVESNLPEARKSDGFVIWWEAADTPDPSTGSVLLPITARSYVSVWPSMQVRSYAISTYRNTYQGMEVGPKVRIAEWGGVEGAGGTGDLSNYLYKPGLSGGQTAYGGTAAGDDLLLVGSADGGDPGSVQLMDATARFHKNALGQTALLIGSDTEPAPLQFAVVNPDASGLKSATFGAFTYDPDGGGSLFFGFSAAGTQASPSPLAVADTIFFIAAITIDSNGDPLSPDADMHFLVSPTTAPQVGYCPMEIHQSHRIDDGTHDSYQHIGAGGWRWKNDTGGPTGTEYMHLYSEADTNPGLLEVLYGYGMLGGGTGIGAGGSPATLTFGGGATGDVATLTVEGGIITGVTTVP